MVNHNVTDIVGSNIRRLRMEKGLLQRELAVRSGWENVNTGRFMLCRIEAGTANVAIDKMIAMANVLDVPFIEFFRGVPGVDANQNKLMTIEDFLEPEEQAMLDRYRSLSPIAKEKTVTYMDDISGNVYQQRNEYSDILNVLEEFVAKHRKRSDS